MISGTRRELLQDVSSCMSKTAGLEGVYKAVSSRPGVFAKRMGIGALLGGLGGFIMDPDEEETNWLGITTKKNNGISARLNNAVTGALLGGTAGGMAHGLTGLAALGKGAGNNFSSAALKARLGRDLQESITAKDAPDYAVKWLKQKFTNAMGRTPSYAADITGYGLDSVSPGILSDIYKKTNTSDALSALKSLKNYDFDSDLSFGSKLTEAFRKLDQLEKASNGGKPYDAFKSALFGDNILDGFNNFRNNPSAFENLF